ncbi:hypothetical protein [Bradyrhizobium sp. McL0616]|uniref:hypothetical protein n=1 Tax=Bradyrhizobium sp. McL0616 TaxID=3415674 RepID=UPI003CF49F83
MKKLKRGNEPPVPVVQQAVSESFMAPTLADVETLARAKTEAAINVLAVIMYRETASPFARVAGATAILDRGWGKPVQPLATDKAPVELLHRIERVIVHPDHSPTIVEQIDDAEPPDVPQLISPSKKKLQ